MPVSRLRTRPSLSERRDRLQRQVRMITASELHQADADARALADQTRYWSRRVEQLFIEFLQTRVYGGKQIDPPLTDLTIDHARAFVIWVREGHSVNPITKAKTTRGPRSVQDHVRALKTFSHWCYEEGWLPQDPLLKLRLPRVPIRVLPTFTAEQLKLLVGVIQARPLEHRNLAMMYFMLGTGVRATELCTVEIPHIDLAKRRALVFGKGSKERVVQFDAVTGLLLQRYMKLERPTLVARTPATSATPPGDRLFVSNYGEAYNRNALRQLCHDLGVAAGIHKQVRCSPHTFRHAQPVSTPVLTPSGWRTMGDLQVGDRVIGADGQPTDVVGIYPQGQQEVMTVRFDDGAAVDCTLDHLWAVHLPATDRWPRAFQLHVLSTAELLLDPRRWRVPAAGAIQFESAPPLPVDPYTLGALLGDGHFGTNLVLATHPEETEIIDRVQAALLPGQEVSGRPGRYLLIGKDGTGLRCNPLLRALQALGLGEARSPDKFIPAPYLTASLEDRRELLRGLMDTDGSATKTSAADFTTISPKLAAGVVELVRSLGGLARVRARLPYPSAKHVAYRVSVRTPFTPFHLTRKAARYEAHPKQPLVHFIKSIRPEGVRECVCIQVANPDGLYVTQDYVLTHNTYATNFLRSHPGSIEQLRQLLGHTDLDMVRRYLHLVEADTVLEGKSPIEHLGLDKFIRA